MSLDRFALLCVAHGLPPPETEVVFAPPRKYRADYGWRDLRILVEQNGGTWNTGGHSTGKGIQRDYAKSNLAQAEGWRLFTFTPQQMLSGEAVEFLKHVIYA